MKIKISKYGPKSFFLAKSRYNKRLQIESEVLWGILELGKNFQRKILKNFDFQAKIDPKKSDFCGRQTKMANFWLWRPQKRVNQCKV